jgi:hypothetical protein
METMRPVLLMLGLVGAPACLSRPPPQAEIDAAAATIRHVAPFVGQLSDATFAASAAKPGDAIVVMLTCESTAAPTFDSPGGGWPWMLIGQGGQAGQAGQTGRWSATFGVIAPNDTITMFTPSVSGTSCLNMDVLGDEFEATDPGGGSMTFDNYAGRADIGVCEALISTVVADEAVWAACLFAGELSGPGAGFEPGANDNHGNAAEFRMATDAPDTPVSIGFASASGTQPYLVSAVTIRPSLRSP